MKNYATPSAPGYNVCRTEKGRILIANDMQKTYQSGVGMLSYLVKHSRPDLANSVRELSKVLDGATQDNYKELLRVIKFTIVTEKKGLRMQPRNEKKWYLSAMSDSDYAGDNDTRISVTGFVIYFMGIPICWRSKAQRAVTLSSTEAEYVACSEVVKGIKFILYILQSLEIKVNLPEQVHIDDVGAIFLAENSNSGDQMKHVDIRYHFVREVIEDGIVSIVFV